VIQAGRMSTPERSEARRIRKDGWTPERQLRFLDALAHTRSATKAAASAGMSRESAYRLRSRGGGLFALLWDRALEPDPRSSEVHTRDMSDGRIMRLLGNHFRRENGDFLRLPGATLESRAR
jgi:hypothetical protein